MNLFNCEKFEVQRRFKSYAHLQKRWLFSLLVILMPLTTLAQINKRITVNYKESSFLEILQDVSKQADNCILFKIEEVEKETRKLTFSLKNATVKEVIDRAIRDLGFITSIHNGIIVVEPMKVAPQIQAKAEKEYLTGQVVDLGGRPLPGVGVVVKGTTRGVITDFEGRYSLEVPARGVVQFIMMGMRAHEAEVRGAGELNVVLEDDALQVGEVVVTGVFNKSRESYTGSVTTITSKSLESFKGQNMIQTLKNVDPSFSIMINNDLGSNPNAIPEITLRGSSSLPLDVEEYNAGIKGSINTPLIIMDGFEISIQKLMDYNNDDIESINILKDASATAIYGSRGANGVIVVTTKLPEPGKLRINFQTNLTMEIPDLSTYDLLNASELLGLQKSLGLYDMTSPGTLYYEESYISRLKDVLSGVNTDWLNYPVRTGVSQKHNLRMEGGDEEFRWGASLGYNSLQGAMKGSARDNFTGSIILSYNLKNVIFKNQLNIGINNSIESPYGNFSTYANMPNYYAPYDENGRPVKDFMGGYTTNTRRANPLYDARLNTRNESNYTDIINNFSIEWNIIEGLRALAQLGISKVVSESDYFLPSNHSYFNESVYQGDEGYFRRGLYRYGSGKSLSYNGNVTLSYSKTFKEKHLIYAGVDYSMQENSSRELMFTLEGLSENMAFPGSANQYEQDGVPFGIESTTRRVGLTSNLNYTFDNRYFADFSYRIDGSSQFGSNNRFAPFWSAGVGWNLHRENFLINSELINTLRLKASYGITGSQQFAAYQAMQTYQYYSDERYLNRTGAYLMALGNDKLRWQATDQYNIGVELGVLNGRVTAMFDYYYKLTSDLLSQRDLPRSTGFVSFIDNIGSVSNRGYEASLNVYPIRNTSKQLVWLVSARLAYNKNQIENLSDAIKEQTENYKAQDVDISTLFYEGYSQNSIWAVRSLGIDPSTGEEIFLDKNGELTTTWEPSAKIYCGISDPLYRGNISSMLRYKDFTFNFSFGFYWGGQVYNQTLINKVEVTTNSVLANNVDRRVLEERWAKPGDLTFFKGFSNTATRATSRFVMDENVFELQSASLQYRLHGRPLGRLNGKVESLLFTINTSDLFHLSTVRRERGTSYPFAKRVGLSVAINF